MFVTRCKPFTQSHGTLITTLLQQPQRQAAWLQHALSVDNSTVSMPPGLTHHLDMSLDWHSEEKLAEQAAAQAEQEQEQGQEQGQQEQEPAIGDDSANAIEGSFTASIDAEGRTEL